jgi:gamma-glutamyl phosphate reductase
MATLHVDVLMSKESERLLKAAARSGRIATLREIAKELNDRADVLEAANAVDVALHPVKPEDEA